MAITVLYYDIFHAENGKIESETTTQEGLNDLLFVVQLYPYCIIIKECKLCLTQRALRATTVHCYRSGAKDYTVADLQAQKCIEFQHNVLLNLPEANADNA